MKIVYTPSLQQMRNCLVIVGGSGDYAEKFSGLVEILSKALPNTSISTITFTKPKRDEDIFQILVSELEQICDQLLKEYDVREIVLFATSLGAYPASFLASNKDYQKYVSRVIFFDPADYYVDPTNARQMNDTWSGGMEYSPNSQLASDRLTKVGDSMKVDVVHLTLRNYSTSNYGSSDNAERGKDSPTLYPRLNAEMVKAFYTKVQEQSRGSFIELPAVPHAFLRDGNVPKNTKAISGCIVHLLEK